MRARWQGDPPTPESERPAAGSWSRRLRGLWPWFALLLLLTVAAALSSHPAKAALRVEAGGGLTLPDASFADFRWDTGPQRLATAGLAMEWSATALGLRAAYHGGSQGTGLPSAAGTPAAFGLGLSTLEVALGRRVLAALGMECWVQGHLGWLHLGFDPDRLRLAGAGSSGEDLWIDVAPVDALCGGGGLLLRRGLLSELALGLELDTLSFAIDSARRVGEALLYERERRTNWRFSLRLDWFPGA